MDIPLAGARADEATSFEPVGKQAQAIAIPPEQFDKIRVLPASQHQLQCCNRDVATDTNASLVADDLDVPRRRGCSVNTAGDFPKSAELKFPTLDVGRLARQ